MNWIFGFGFGSTFRLQILYSYLPYIKRKCDYIKFSSKNYPALKRGSKCSITGMNGEQGASNNAFPNVPKKITIHK